MSKPELKTKDIREEFDGWGWEQAEQKAKPLFKHIQELVVHNNFIKMEDFQKFIGDTGFGMTQALPHSQVPFFYVGLLDLDNFEKVLQAKTDAEIVKETENFFKSNLIKYLKIYKIIKQKNSFYHLIANLISFIYFFAESLAHLGIFKSAEDAEKFYNNICLVDVNDLIGR